MPNFTYVNNIPVGNLTPADQRANLAGNCSAVNSILGGDANVDMIGFNDNDGGWHKKLTYVLQASAPGSSANQLVTYSKEFTYPDASTGTELYFQRDGTATEIQLTNGEPRFGSVSTNDPSITFLPGGMKLTAGRAVVSGGVFTFPYPQAQYTTVYSCVVTFEGGNNASISIDNPGTTSVSGRCSQNGTVHLMILGI